MKENSKIEDSIQAIEHSPTLLAQAIEDEKKKGLICPNCGAPLEGRKCKLMCTRRGCGYLVTCSEW